jgi:hypothetical protein
MMMMMMMVIIIIIITEFRFEKQLLFIYKFCVSLGIWHRYNICNFGQFEVSYHHKSTDIEHFCINKSCLSSAEHLLCVIQWLI